MNKNKIQSRQFINAAKEHEADLDESIFEQAVKQVVKPQPAKKKSEKDESDDHVK